MRRNSPVATSAAAPQPLPDPTVRRDWTVAATNHVQTVSFCVGCKQCNNRTNFFHHLVTLMLEFFLLLNTKEFLKNAYATHTMKVDGDHSLSSSKK